MVFQVRKWGWKQLATNLLLIPVLTGGAATVAQAQVSSGPAMAQTSSTPALQNLSLKTTDPKILLQEGRKALAAGDFDRAKDLSREAEANNPSGRWGLFDDTPNTLRRDIESTIAKAKKAQAESLTKQAKALMAKEAPTDREKAANLDQALQFAHRAVQLHGPYTAWDLGDRADKLEKEIQAARSHLNVASTVPNPALMNASQNPSSFMPAANTPAGAMAARATPLDTKKLEAQRLMSDAKKLADQGMYGQAKVKLIEADHIGANFGPGDYSPNQAMQELSLRGSKAIDKLIAESKSQISKKDFAKAEADLNGATDIAASLGLSYRSIEDIRSQLRTATAGKFGGLASSDLATTSGETVAPKVPTVPSVASVPSVPALLPSVATTSPAATVVKTPVVTSGSLSANELLRQAEVYYSHADLDMAAKLAQQAHNLGAQDEARRLLNTIDAERLNLKTISARRSLDNAMAAFNNKDYSHAQGVLVLIDPMLLTPEQEAKRKELLATCHVELKKLSIGESGVAVAGGMQTAEPPGQPPVGGDLQVPPSLNPPGTSMLGNDPKAGADNVASQVDALRKVQFQKFRAEGNKVQTDAAATFGRGEPDLAIQMLQDYAARVKAANLEPSSTVMLLRPIESKLDTMLVMRGNQVAIARLNKENQTAKEIVASRGGLAEEQRKAEIKELFTKCHSLMKQEKYAEAEKVALQAKQLDPDNPACTALAEMAKLTRSVKDAEKLKEDKERTFRLGLNAAEREGPMVDVDNPISVSLERSRIARGRGPADSSYLRTHTPATYEIELKMNKPISIDFHQTPLDQAVENLKTQTGIPLVIDYMSLEAEGISSVKPITVAPGIPVAAKNLLTFTLEQAGLSYVIENDLVKVTTTKKAKGRLFTRVFSVADLVTPVPNFTLPDFANVEKMFAASTNNWGSRSIQGFGGNSPGGMNGGVPIAQGTMATTPGISPAPSPGGHGGTLQTNPFGSENPLGRSVSLANDGNTKHEQLIKLITGMVRPYSWDGMGGPGHLEFYDIGSALVVNQTADVIQEVADLLDALRRLQDLAIAVELRIVSLSESWFERMGVDFSLNILTNTSKIQPSLTTVDPNTGAAGVFSPLPYINAIRNVGSTVGLTPAGTFTPDLNVPITNSSYNMAIPPFGGYPNTPGADGGVSLGLAFLNEIQVYLFMEAAAGDRRVNVMQAPKLTLFNGQTASISISSTQFAVTNVQVISVNGQIVFSPINTPLPGPGQFNPIDPLQAQLQGPGMVSVTIQGVVSADRRFVRLNLPVTMAAQTGTTVPLFPVTTFVTPVFEGGSQGQPIPFTQFLQQPSYTTLQINTTVVCPDGGTVLLGGFKQLSEGRNEFGPPFLSDIPYLNRLFKNVGIGRETTHIMIMVTPRIIINTEEEIFQTEGRPSQ